MSAGHHAADGKVTDPSLADKYYQATRDLVADCAIDDTHEVLYASNRTPDGKKVWIDYRIPALLPKCGVNTRRSLPTHELGEWLAENDGLPYFEGEPSAHVDVATVLELREVQAQFPDDPDIVGKYNAEMDEYVALIAAHPIVNPPPEDQVDQRPYDEMHVEGQEPPVSDVSATSLQGHLMRRTYLDRATFRAALKDVAPPSSAIILRYAATDALTASASDDRVVSFVFSDGSVDRYGDTIDARGWVLENYAKSPVALFGHDTGSAENVIGKARNVRIEGNRLVGEIEFAAADVNPTAESVYRMVKAGYLTACSVGFAPVEWSLAKDKSRPGGIDFKKQELLEISVVPVPANPNAVALAKAAGIDVDRLKLTKTFVVSKKGLYGCASLADLLNFLGYLQEDAAWEAEYEGDGSEVPQMLLDAMKQLGAALVAMTIEEVGELLAGRDPADPPIVDDIYDMSALTPAQKAVRALARSLAGGEATSDPLAAAFSEDEVLALRALITPAIRAGKVLSAANEKCIRDAHGHITKGCEMIKGMLDEATASTEPAGDDGEAKALRARRAAALKQQVSLGS